MVANLEAMKTRFISGFIYHDKEKLLGFEYSFLDTLIGMVLKSEQNHVEFKASKKAKRAEYSR